MQYLTQKQLQDKYGVTRQCIFKWRKLGLPHTQFSRALIFDEAAVAEWYDKYKRGLFTK